MLISACHNLLIRQLSLITSSHTYNHKLVIVVCCCDEVDNLSLVDAETHGRINQAFSTEPAPEGENKIMNSLCNMDAILPQFGPNEAIIEA